MSDLLDAIKLSDHPEPEVALACLDALAVFDVDVAGLRTVEPLLARCWPHRQVIGNGEEPSAPVTGGV